MERNYLIHTRDGNKVLTAAEIIANALEQEAAGIKPHLSYADPKTREPITPPGWLVWSTWDDGAGVVYRREDGKMIIVTGWQGEFLWNERREIRA